jgi:sRNA-binding regulator protein Hfq
MFKGTKHFQRIMLRAERIVFTNGEELTDCDIILTEEGIGIVKDDQFTLVYHHAVQSLQFTERVAINFMRARALSDYLEDVSGVQETLEEFDYAVKELQEHLEAQVQQVQAEAEEEASPDDNGKNPYA